LLPQFNYLAVHGLYWAGRSYLAQGMKKDGLEVLLRAKKYKKCEMNIEVKIDRVIADAKMKK
jgi:hypothetical protein